MYAPNTQSFSKANGVNVQSNVRCVCWSERSLGVRHEKLALMVCDQALAARPWFGSSLIYTCHVIADSCIINSTHNMDLTVSKNCCYLEEAIHN